MRLFNTGQPARNVENSTHDSIIEPLLLRLTLPPEILHLNINIWNHAFYVRIEVNNYTEGRVGWQRCDCFKFRISSCLFVFVFAHIYSYDVVIIVGTSTSVEASVVVTCVVVVVVNIIIIVVVVDDNASIVF